jgi:hypothetical protein
VSGTFRNLSGTIASIDPAASTLVVKDLATKKQVTIHITSDAQMRRIPDRMAQMMAARLKGTTPPGGAAGGWQQRAGANGGAAPSAGGAAPQGGAAPAGSGQGGGGQWAGAGGGGAGGGDPQRMLTMAPAIKLEELQKGEAVMIVATDGATDVNAITLLAGVEPLLEAPAATNLLSNWSMGGGGDAAAGGGGGGQ